jgi:hypothetical protein
MGRAKVSSSPQLADSGGVEVAGLSIARPGASTHGRISGYPEVSMRLALLSCIILISCTNPRGPNWLECSLITTDGSSKDIGKHREFYIVNPGNQTLYSYAPDSREVIGPMKDVAFWSPDLINHDVEVSSANFITNHVLKINLKTMEIVNRTDTIGTGYNSGSSTHSVMGGTCKWISPLQVG